ncbi:hypothetical protein GH714_006530 [Hevea brasiliensis]|uniref:Uncharacterized protein n=1 Tax=Hevea brasiliensis TaxID=3981 RepID=A0A6A6M7J4_HEVBR|nr:hypothetical protein GH714_006530 [Hevea brasiliensis]
MCEDCSSSPQAEFSNKFAFFPWMKKLGVVQDCCGDKVSENVEVTSKCACCGVCLEKKLCCPDNYLMKPSWGDSDNIHKGNYILEAESDDKIDEEDHSDRKRSGFVCDRWGEEQGIDKNRGVEDRNWLESVEKDELNVSVNDPSCNQAVTVQKAGCKKDVSSEIQPQHLEFYIDQDDCHLIPIDLMDSSRMEKQISNRNEKREEENCGDEDFVLEFDKHVGTQYELVVEDRFSLDEKVPLLPIQEGEEETMIAELESREFDENESSSGVLADYELKEDLEEVAIAQLTQNPTSNGDDVIQEGSEITGEEMESDKNQVSEEVLQMYSDEIEADISIGTEIPDHERIEDFQSREAHPSCLSVPEDLSTCIANYHACDDESNDIEEDKIPDTPTSVDSLHHLHKKLLFLEKRESGTEESLDGSVISDIEAGDGVLTAEKLKSGLKAERKALRALYAELEEEREVLLQWLPTRQWQ